MKKNPQLLRRAQGILSYLRKASENKEATYDRYILKDLSIGTAYYSGISNHIIINFNFNITHGYSAGIGGNLHFGANATLMETTSTIAIYTLDTLNRTFLPINYQLDFIRPMFVGDAITICAHARFYEVMGSQKGGTAFCSCQFRRKWDDDVRAKGLQIAYFQLGSHGSFPFDHTNYDQYNGI